jgi:hypothetical protein
MVSAYGILFIGTDVVMPRGVWTNIVLPYLVPSHSQSILISVYWYLANFSTAHDTGRLLWAGEPR